MSIIRWEPLDEPATIRNALDRWFEEPFARPVRLWDAGAGVLPVDMYETDTGVVVSTSLPGVKPEEAEITITGDALTIRGETRAEEEVKREDYYHQERRYGKFTRVVTLPGSLRTDKAEAVFQHGVLTITIPKAEEAKPKQIKVKASSPVEAKKS